MSTSTDRGELCPPTRHAIPTRSIVRGAVMASDFDFKISKNRHLRGRGWGGLIALGMLLFAALVLVAEVRDLWLPMRLYLGL